MIQVKPATRIAIWICSAAFAALGAIEALSRFATFHNRTFDLALYACQAWGLAHGDLWEPVIGCHFFGTHVAVVLADDPAADLHDWYGRYWYFAPDELEPLPAEATP